MAHAERKIWSLSDRHLPQKMNIQMHQHMHLPQLFDFLISFLSLIFAFPVHKLFGYKEFSSAHYR